MGCREGGSFSHGEKNSPPRAYDVTTTTLINKSKDIILQAVDKDSSSLSYRITTNPGHGTLIKKSYNIFRYIPKAGYEGADSFHFIANDGDNDSNEATVTIRVGTSNHAPVVKDAVVHTDINQECEIPITATDKDGDKIYYTVISEPEKGTVVQRDSKYYYQPEENDYGAYHLKFQARDDYSTSDIATIAIEIDVKNTPPIALAVTATIAEDQQYIIPFSIAENSQEIWDTPPAYSISTQPEHGTVVCEEGVWTYTPEANYNGVDSFYYRAHDGIDYSEPTPVTLQITPEKDAPTVANHTIIVLEHSTNYNIAITGQDPDGDQLTFTIGDTSSLPGEFSYTNGNTHGVYTSPPADLSTSYGLYDITYSATDPDGLMSNTGHIYIVIRPKNVWFVNPNNKGLETGQCWHEGFRYISDAIDSASPGDQIWLLGGVSHTIKPGNTVIADLTGKFSSPDKKGISLLGSFPLNNYNINSASLTTHKTILTGDDGESSHAEHIIIAESYCKIKDMALTRGESEAGFGGGICITHESSSISISSVEITNSSALSGGGFYIGKKCKDISISNSVFKSNSANIHGGGGAVGEQAEVALTNCNFESNHSLDFGGGLSNLGTVTVTNTSFSNNEAKYGAGVYDHDNPSEYTLCRFIKNTSSNTGGGILNCGSIKLTGCNISENKAHRGGGMVNDGSGMTLLSISAQIIDCSITKNIATYLGGGIYNLHSHVSISTSAGTSEISENKTSNIDDECHGGGIYCTEGTRISIENTEIKKNSSKKTGGGIYAQSYSNVSIGHSIISQNSSTVAGGGIYLSNAKSELINTKIEENSSHNSDRTSGKGGGICVENYGYFSFNNLETWEEKTPIFKNSAGQFGGGIYSLKSTIIIKHANIRENQFFHTGQNSNEYGDGGGIFAKNSNCSIKSTFIEKNHGILKKDYHNNPLNYSGYHLVNCSSTTVNLIKSKVDEDNSYNELYGNYLMGRAYDSEHNNYYNVEYYTNQFSPDPLFLEE